MEKVLDKLPKRDFGVVRVEIKKADIQRLKQKLRLDTRFISISMLVRTCIYNYLEEVDEK